MESSKMYIPVDNFYSMIAKNFIWGLFGIVLGIIVNNIIGFMSNKLKIKTLLIQNVLQLVLCSFVLALIHAQFNYFGWTWQNITPGLFFVSFFFGVQFNIFTNIQSTYISTIMK